MRSLFKQILISSILILAVFEQPAESNNPTDKVLKQRADKWLTVKSWTASYNETYTSVKTWEMRPGVTMKTTIKSTISGTFALDSLVSDGQYYGEWYGFGSGSSISDQIVTMISSGPDGEISITEKTNTVGSGAIGTTDNNEYGENWGGSFSIDIYNGTYNFGFGGPDADGKATFTRTVEGLPTDYSDLEKLPEGLKEIFVPLGEKAEEWATYSGPLEDARGVMVGGLAGFNLFPDMDEPTEYSLPKGSKVLKGSYTGKSITKNWTISQGGAVKLLELEKVDKDWIPDAKLQTPVTIKVNGDGLNGDKVKMRFTLYEVTNETGFCMNSEDDSKDFDLEFEQFSSNVKFKNPVETEDGWIIETSKKVLNASIDVIPFDWGAWGKLKAEAEIDEDVWIPIYTKEGEGYITIPLDERGGIDNKIADAFEIQHRWSEGIKTMQDDEGSNNVGDGLTAYEEYRGLMIGGEGGRHITTNPEDTLDLFVFCTSPTIRRYLPDGTVVGGELLIHLLGLESDYVNNNVRLINPNSKKWRIVKQHGILLKAENIPDAGVVGWAIEAPAGDCSSPGKTDYVALDLGELSGSTNSYYKITIVHELMHGCGIEHHGEVNTSHTDAGVVYSVALWDGVNAGDYGCTMQYGFGDIYSKANGVIAKDATGNFITFNNTEDKIAWNYLCITKQGSGFLKHPQLGPAAKGACIHSLHVSDE